MSRMPAGASQPRRRSKLASDELGNDMRLFLPSNGGASLVAGQGNEIPHDDRTIVPAIGEPDRRGRSVAFDRDIAHALSVDLLDRSRNDGDSEAGRHQMDRGWNRGRFLAEPSGETRALAAGRDAVIQAWPCQARNQNERFVSK